MQRLLLPLKTLRGFLTVLLTTASLLSYGQLSVEVFGENIGCFGLSSGTATAEVFNGTPPFSYVWSNGGTTATITNLSAGTYGVTVTDDNGLTGQGAITLTEPPRVIATISEATECSAPFTIAAEPEGGVVPYTYNWSTGADTRAVSVPAGDYCVTVVDANLCGYVACTTVEENPPMVSLVDVDVRCAGDDDGAITANPSGGVAPYTYQWSNGQNTQTITDLAPGVYSVVLTDARGCTATATTTISEPPALAGSISGNSTVCPGEATAFLMIVPSGGVPPYSYNWSPGNFSGQGIGPLPAGAYSVTVTDANNCTLVRSFVVLTSDDVEVEIEGDEILCGVGTTGTLTASPVEGPVSQYVYNWSTGASGPTITNVGPGVYTVTATDANGCTGTATATVSTVALDLDLFSTPTSCEDGNDGTATAVATGGQQPYTYEWTNGGSTATISGLAPGVYGVTVTEAGQAACKVSGTVVVGAPDAIALTAVPTNVDCAGASTGAVDLTVSGGTAPYTYQWSNGSVNEDLSGVPAGTYTVVVTDANGCTESLVVNISQPTPLNIDEQVTNVACAGENTGRIAVFVSGGVQPYTYAWSTGATSSVINNLAPGNYTVTVTDANGCTLVESYTITAPPAIVVSGVVTDILCPGDNDGAINVTASGGTGTLTFSWSNGAITEDLSGIAAGTYTVTVLDANECTATATFTVNEPEDLVLTAIPTNVDCFGGNDGSIAVNVSGGTAPYVIRLNNVIVNDGDLDNLPAGTYTVSIADVNGCAESTTVVIQQPTDFNVVDQVTPVACLGDATGSINLTVSGATPGYSFAWSNGATTEDIFNLTAGDYTVTITDANGCTFTATYTVGTNSLINVTGVASPADCNGEASGDVDITVSGGSGTYSFQWSNGATTQDLVNVPAGTYTVTVLDANECDAVATFVVTEPDEIDLTVNAPTITCGGTETGSITVFPSGGTGPYSYLWSNGDTGMTISGVGAGAYTVTVTDANGCTDVTGGIVLNELPELTCELVVNQQPTMGNNGSISVVVDGGTIPYTYAWDDGSTSPDRTGLGAGTYSVTVTDANNCTTECMVTLQAFAGIGDFVWEDWNVNGQQDPGEPGIADYPVYLKNAAGVIVDSTRTDENGFYSFLGLIPGDYSILFPEAPGGIRTLFNTGDDTSDNDADPDMNGMTQVYTLAPGEFNMTVDAGFFAEPGGEITDPCICLNNNTNDDNGQFREVFEVIANPGQTWTIVSATNAFQLTGQGPPVPPVPLAIGTVIPQVEIDANDPSRARYELEIRLVDELTYTIVVSNGLYEVTFTNTCIYPTVQILNFPTSPVCQYDAPTTLVGAGSVPGDVVFTINGVQTNVFNPLDLGVGTYEVQAQLFPNDADECLVTLTEEIAIIDDCLAKLGNYVWYDANQNGLQDNLVTGAPELPVEGVVVELFNGDGTTTGMTTTTDANGMYMFSDLIPGDYFVMFMNLPTNFFPTDQDTGTNDEIDSDVDLTTLKTVVTTLDPDEVDLSWDMGIYINPNPEILDPCSCNERTIATLVPPFDGYFFSERVEVFATPGSVWYIIDEDIAEGVVTENILVDNGEGLPIPLDFSSQDVFLEEFPDQPGRFFFDFFHETDLGYSIVVTDGIDTLNISNLCVSFPPPPSYPELLEGNCFSCETITLPTMLPAEGDNPGGTIEYFFLSTIPIAEIFQTGVDESELINDAIPIPGGVVSPCDFIDEPGNITLYLRYTPNDVPGAPDGANCPRSIFAELNLLDSGPECGPAGLGDYVWADVDGDGVQDDNEPGVPGITVNLKDESGTVIATTTTDATGYYEFIDLVPGTYSVQFVLPDGDTFFTNLNAGNNEAIDSDADPAMNGMTAPVTLVGEQFYPDLDAGLILPCIENVNNPGAIAASQELCGPGNVPQPLVEIAPATGGQGEITYLWMFNTEDPGQDISYWQPIPNSNTINYAPGVLYETTFFTRCVRRNNCPFIESNVLTIEIGDDAVADISGPSAICVGTEAIFQATNPGAGASISWTFSGSSTVQTATGPTVATTWQTFGSFSVTLTVTRNGCTSTDVFNIQVLNSPTQCGGNLTANGTVNNLQARDVVIEWEVPADGSEQAFQLERSVDGANFSAIADVTTPQFTSGNGMNVYRRADVSPLAGRTFYRVRMLDPVYGDMLSNVVEMNLSGETTALGRIFPNPAQNGMIHVEMTAEASAEASASVQMYDVRGNAVGARSFLAPGSGVINLNADNQAAGLYFIRLTVGDRTETHRVILE